MTVEKPIRVWPILCFVGGILCLFVLVMQVIRNLPEEKPEENSHRGLTEVEVELPPNMFKNEKDADVTGLDVQSSSNVVPSKDAIPTWGNELLGKNVSLEDQQAVEYRMDEDGVITQKMLHGRFLLLPGERTTSFAKILKPGRRLVVYWKTNTPKIQVFEFIDEKQGDVDVEALDAEAEKGLVRSSPEGIRTNHGVAFVFVSPVEKE